MTWSCGSVCAVCLDAASQFSWKRAKFPTSQKKCVRQLVKVLAWSNKPKASLFWVVRRCWWMLTPEKLFALPLPPSYRLVTAREGQGKGCSNSFKHSYSLQCSPLKSPFQAVLEPAAEMAELIPRSSHKNSLLLFALGARSAFQRSSLGASHFMAGT